MLHFRARWRTMLRVLGRRYWSLPARRRHVVGWTLVVMLVVTAVVTIYVAWRGVAWTTAWVVSAWNETTYRVEKTLDLAEPPVVSTRLFSVAQKHPQRKPNYARDFNDINDTQLRAAGRLGIHPRGTRDELKHLADEGRLVKLESNKYYKIDPLTHSSAYLVPDAAAFLAALGQLLQEYDGTPSRFIITSVTRTRADVSRLRRVNKNASDNSCHYYGTTFDIAYNRFDRRGKTNDGRLKENLARALYDMRASGHCYVKYEYRQACFHVTVRPRR